jgi:hypothetical protein
MIKYQEILCGGESVTFIKDIYINIMTCVRACGSESVVFLLKIRLHQGLSLSSYIFTLVVDEIIKDIQ